MRKLYLQSKSFVFHNPPGDPYLQDFVTKDLSLEPVIWAAQTYVESGDGIILDIGSNIGVTGIAFSQIVPNGTVHCFEPSSRNFRCLTRNITENNIRNIQTHQIALSDKMGEVSFYDTANFGAGSFIAKEDSLAARNHKHEQQMVLSYTLDMFVKEQKINRVDFIKIDVEGYELGVLRGAQNTLNRFKPLVILEINSYAMITHAQMLPQVALDEIQGVFPYLYNLDEYCRITPLNTDQEKHAFIHDNITQGRADNVIASYSPLQPQNNLSQERKIKVSNFQNRLSRFIRKHISTR